MMRPMRTVHGHTSADKRQAARQQIVACRLTYTREKDMQCSSSSVHIVRIRRVRCPDSPADQRQKGMGDPSPACDAPTLLPHVLNMHVKPVFSC